MNEDEYKPEEAWYHFALGDIAQAIALYGLDRVMVDIYDKVEIENMRLERVYD